MCTSHEGTERPDEGVGPLSNASMGDEIRTIIGRSTERIEKKIDSVQIELKEDIKGLDRMISKIDVKISYLSGLLLVIGIGGGILLLFP